MKRLLLAALFVTAVASGFADRAIVDEGGAERKS